MILADLPVPTRNPDEVTTGINRILARPEFQRPPKNLFERLQDWGREALSRVIDNLLGSGAGTVLAWVLLIGGVTVLILVLSRAGRTVQTDHSVGTADVMIELTKTPSEWRREADELEATGDFKGGIRARHRALVADLVERGVLSDLPGRTSGEYAREVAAATPDLAQAFTPATDLFERVWYGNAACGPAERDEMVALSLAVSGARS